MTNVGNYLIFQITEDGKGEYLFSLSTLEESKKFCEEFPGYYYLSKYKCDELKEGEIKK